MEDPVLGKIARDLKNAQDKLYAIVERFQNEEAERNEITFKLNTLVACDIVRLDDRAWRAWLADCSSALNESEKFASAMSNERSDVWFAPLHEAKRSLISKRDNEIRRRAESI
jgi:hypothetical protein